MLKQFLFSAILASASTCVIAQNTFTNPINFDVNINGDSKLIEAENNIYSGYNTVFYVTGDGSIGGKCLRLSKERVGFSYCAKMFMGYEKNSTDFIFSTSSYPGKFYPIVFRASAFTFDNATSMTINCPVTCKNSFDVISLNANNIKTNDITVDLSNAADYVFEDNYNLKSLSEVESYVKENKHLPGMPSASEFAEKGMSVSEMSNKLLEKVEELTLHLIRLEKENLELKKEIQDLKK